MNFTDRDHSVEQASQPATQDASQNDEPREAQKKILLNAFDMSTVGHLSPGQWKV